MSQKPPFESDQPLQTSSSEPGQDSEFSEAPSSPQDSAGQELTPENKSNTSVEQVPSSSEGLSTAETELGDCRNCHTPLVGPYCHSCGQSQKSVIRFVGGLLADVADEVFGFDARSYRTLLPLLFRPGFLTNQYIAGKRLHYVPPVRIYFIASLLLFVTLKLITMSTQDDAITVNTDGTEVTVLSPEDVGTESSTQPDSAEPADNNFDPSDSSLTESKYYSAQEQGDDPQRTAEDAVNPVIQATEQATSQVQQAIEEAQVADQAELSPPPVIDPEDGDVDVPNEVKIRLGGADDYLTFDFLADDTNALLVAKQKEMEAKAENLGNAKSFKDVKPYIIDFLEVAPIAMFFLLPVFALLLKFFYPFSRRYYMEHMITALHSHSFMFVTILVIMALSWLKPEGDGGFVSAIRSGLGIASTLLIIWIPIYLFISQYKIYKQGFIVTFLKFSVIGLIYQVLITLLAVIAAMISLLLS